MAGQCVIQDIADEGGFAGAGDAGNADEFAQGNSTLMFLRLCSEAPLIVNILSFVVIRLSFVVIICFLPDKY